MPTRRAPPAPRGEAADAPSPIAQPSSSRAVRVVVAIGSLFCLLVGVGLFYTLRALSSPAPEPVATTAMPAETSIQSAAPPPTGRPPLAMPSSSEASSRPSTTPFHPAECAFRDPSQEDAISGAK